MERPPTAGIPFASSAGWPAAPNLIDYNEMRETLAQGRIEATREWRAWGRVALPIAVAAVLLCLAAANLAVRATWREAEDGVLWVGGPEGIVAAEIAPGTAAAAAGLRAGDILLALDGRPAESVRDVVDVLHASRVGAPLTYTVVRLDAQRVVQLHLTPVPQGHRSAYYMLAAIGIFTLLVGVSVRLRRPEDQATLHFFWLCVAFFGVFAFSYSGRLDRLDWAFYWADEVARLLLPPLFVHFAVVFPEHAWSRRRLGRALVPLGYVPALVLFAAQVAALERAALQGPRLGGLLERIERLELSYLAICLAGGLVVMALALRRVRSVTARRQLRWIVWGTALGAGPFILGYLVPYGIGFNPPASLEWLAIPLGLVPLAFASAIVRYRLMDVEVIIKRSLVYAAAISAIAIIYALLLQLAREVFLGGSEQHNTIIALLSTLVVVLLARPVQNLIQTTLDRAYYRDRYDYRRALVGFARDLNSDLDLARLSDRLVTRVTETLVVDRMALLCARAGAGVGDDFVAIRAAGFAADAAPLRLARESGVGTRLLAGHIVPLDDPRTARRFAADEVAGWRDLGIHYFVPCVAKGETTAVMALGRKTSAEPLSSEDMALLAAVAGQVATALENGRLYRELHLKADELRRLREFSENIIESLGHGLVVIDLDDRVIRWNAILEQLYGVARGAALGQKIDALFDAPFLEAVRAARREDLPEANLYRVSLMSRHTDNHRRLLVNAAMAPLRTPDGAVAGTMIILEDITARVQLEEQLQISEKMASLGLLAAGVAHEVNTPLTGISSFTQMLLDRADPDDPGTRLLEKIERQTFRAAKIVNGLLNLARPAQAEKGPVDLNAVVNDVLSLLEHQFKTGRILVRKELSSRPPIVSGIEYKLQQVFLNLFLNARDAMPSGGWLSIATRLDGTHVDIDVADTGAGIPTELLSRIYDPFFTTKDLGQGTGLGLSITYGIVQEHGGTINCESAVGQGTRFTLSLPLAASHERTGEGAG